MAGSMRLTVFAFVVVFLAGCILPQPEVVCNKPYIKVGTSCCLDVNDNKICDDHETMTSVVITTSVLPTTTTPKPETTASTSVATTTTTFTCSVNSDCGQTHYEGKPFCLEGKIARVLYSPFCRHPGTLEAECISKIKNVFMGSCMEDSNCTDCINYYCYNIEISNPEKCENLTWTGGGFNTYIDTFS